jgi:hypothetical protein
LKGENLQYVDEFNRLRPVATIDYNFQTTIFIIKLLAKERAVMCKSTFCPVFP